MFHDLSCRFRGFVVPLSSTRCVVAQTLPVLGSCSENRVWAWFGFFFSKPPVSVRVQARKAANAPESHLAQLPSLGSALAGL